MRGATCAPRPPSPLRGRDGGAAETEPDLAREQRAVRDVDAGAPAREARSVCALGWPAGLSLGAAWAMVKNLGSLPDSKFFLILIAALIAAYRAALIVEQVEKSGTDPVGKPWLYLSQAGRF